MCVFLHSYARQANNMQLNRASAGRERRLEASSGSPKVSLGMLAPAGYAVGGGLGLSDVGPGVSNSTQELVSIIVSCSCLMSLSCAIRCPDSPHSLLLIFNILDLGSHFWILKRPVTLFAPKEPSTIILDIFMPHSATPTDKLVQSSDPLLPELSFTTPFSCPSAVPEPAVQNKSLRLSDTDTDSCLNDNCVPPIEQYSATAIPQLMPNPTWRQGQYLRSA